MRASRWWAVVVLAGPLALAGCARLAPHAAAVPDAAPGAVVTLFTVDDVIGGVHRFGIYGAVPQPAGTVLVSYDVSVESPGDETPIRPRLAVLGAAGHLEAVALPVLDGQQVDPAASLLSGAPDGTYYLWDRRNDRVIAHRPDGTWRVVPVPMNVRDYAPLSAVGADGSLYVADQSNVLRLAPDDTVTRIANVVPPAVADDIASAGDEGLPRPATEVLLQQPSGMAIAPDGAVYLSSRNDVVVVRPDGIVRYVGSSAGLLRAAGVSVEDSWGSAYFFSALGIDADDALLLSDPYGEHLLRLDDSGPVLVGRHLILATNGENASFSPDRDLLVLVPDLARPGPEHMVQLAAYGR